MKFTTKLILAKDKPKEKYNYPVLTQHSFNVEDRGSYTKFELNSAAMLEFGFKVDTPNVNKINWGIDEETGKLLLANTNGLIQDKLSNITATNTFANGSFLDKLVKEFSIDPLQVHEFKLNLQPDENEFMIASLELIKEEVFVIDPEEPVSDTPLEQACDNWYNIKDINEYEEIF